MLKVPDSAPTSAARTSKAAQRGADDKGMEEM